MTQAEVFDLLCEVLEMPAGSLTGPEELRALENWDSLAIMGLVALVDQRCGVLLSAQTLVACRTVNDLAEVARADSRDA